MSDKKTPPSSRDFADEIQTLKDDVASFKARFAVPPGKELEEALTRLSAERPHPVTQEAKGTLSNEIQAFKVEISALKDQIAEHEQKLTDDLDDDEDES